MSARARRALFVAAGLVLAALAVPNAAQAGAPLDQAVATVHAEANHYHGSRANRLAWATFRFVNRTVRSDRNSGLPPAERPTSVDEALSKRAGACGNAVAVTLAIADRIGLKARPVEFYYTDVGGQIGSHVVVEFYVHGGWRLYDVLFNTVYRSKAHPSRLLSTTRLLRLSRREQMIRKDAGPDVAREKYERQGHDPYRYLHDPHAEITINDHGILTMPRTGPRTFAPIPNRPNYVGQAQTYGLRRSNLRQRLTGVRFDDLHVRLISGCTSGQIIARSQTTVSAPLTAATTDVTLPVQGSEVTLSVSGGCYAVISSVRQV